MLNSLEQISFHQADQYAQKYSSKTDDVLQELYAYTKDHVKGAQMISGPLQGKFLEMISIMLQPMHIIELGTYTGYATLCLTKGLQHKGNIHIIDIDESLQSIRDKYWEMSSLNHKIKQYIGKANEIIPTINATFDLAFIDADKNNYITYLDQLIALMPNGSHILADNTLFHGEVLKSEALQGKNGKYMHAFNDYVLQHPNLQSVLLPFRDGITLIRIQK